MKEKSNIKSKILIVIAIISTCIACWVDTVNSTCLADIYAAFPDANTFLQGYIVTGPYFVSIPLVLIIGKIADKVDKKLMILLFLILDAVGGVCGAFATSMGMYAVCRTFAGISVVVIGSLGFSLMFENFPNANDSAKVMGLFQAFSQIYGMALATVVGIVATYSWRTAQYLNAVAIVSAVLVLLFIPKSKRSVKSKEEKSDLEQSAALDAAKDTTNKKGIFITMLESVFVVILGYVFYYYVALYVEERGLGTTALAGTLVSTLTVGSFLASIVFAKYYKKFQRYGGIIAAFISALSFILLGFNVPVWVVFVLAFLNGLACGIVNGFYPIAVNLYASPNKTAFFQGMYTAVNSIGITLCAYVPSASMAIFGSGYQRSMLVTGIAIAVWGCLVFVPVKKYLAKNTVDNI